MQLLAGVKLCTGRTITNHPHFEDKQLRERTLQVRLEPCSSLLLRVENYNLSRFKKLKSGYGCGYGCGYSFSVRALQPMSYILCLCQDEGGGDIYRYKGEEVTVIIVPDCTILSRPSSLAWDSSYKL